MLHGEIKMNHVVIGEYTAVHHRDYQGYRDYKCTIWYRHTDGYIYEAEWDMWGRHFKPDGAISLAAKVLMDGYKKAKKRPIQTDFPVEEGNQ